MESVAKQRWLAESINLQKRSVQVENRNARGGWGVKCESRRDIQLEEDFLSSEAEKVLSQRQIPAISTEKESKVQHTFCPFFLPKYKERNNIFLAYFRSNVSEISFWARSPLAAGNEKKLDTPSRVYVRGD